MVSVNPRKLAWTESTRVTLSLIKACQYSFRFYALYIIDLSVMAYFCLSLPHIERRKSHAGSRPL